MTTIYAIFLCSLVAPLFCQQTGFGTFATLAECNAMKTHLAGAFGPAGGFIPGKSEVVCMEREIETWRPAR